MADTLERNETQRLIASDKVEGTTVYNPQCEKLGKVANVMIDKRSGKSEYACCSSAARSGWAAITTRCRGTC